MVKGRCDGREEQGSNLGRDIEMHLFIKTITTRKKKAARLASVSGVDLTFV